MLFGRNKTHSRRWASGVMGIALVLSLLTPSAFAADGSGTNTVLPTSADAGSTGNTLTFTHTAAETMSSGELAITVPSGWSDPQGTNGVAGYTTVTSAGTIGTVLDAGDSTSGWSAGTACTSGLTLDTSVKQEGTGSISCANGNEADTDRWYKNISAQDWSGYTKVGFWIRSNIGIANANRLRFAYDNDANLATPIEQIDLSSLVTANTWTYMVINFGATTRTSVASFGFVILNAELDNNTVWIDDVLVGPGVPSFPGDGDIRTRLLQLTGTQTVTVTYGAGGGASGATAPASGETSSFLTKTRISDAGTLTSIASSPTVTVNNPVPTTTSISPTSKTAGQGIFTITVNGTNFVPSSVVQFDGSARTTDYVSATQLTASIPASDITANGSFPITVFNPTPTGGTSNSQTLTVAPDSTAPAAVTNLVLSSPTTSSMVLTWTAPGDDGSSGTATLYDIRYSTSSIVTGDDFTAASLVSGEPVPSVAGTSQNMTVTGLSANTIYYFAMKTSDEVPNISAVSNVPSSATTATSSPQAVPGKITVINLVVNDNGGVKTVADFSLLVNGVPVTSGVATTFFPSAAYDVTQAADANYDTTFTGDCDATGRLSLNAGEIKFCTVTNNDRLLATPSASITVPGLPDTGTVPLPSAPPLIDLVKVPSPLALSDGPGLVLYTFTLENIGTVPVTNVSLVGDTCSPILLASGDMNADAKLDVDETWTYTCSATLTQTHTNTAVASGWANGLLAVDVANATVVVGASIVPPFIRVTKVPSPLALPVGGGVVRYLETVTNPGIVPLANIRLTDDKCAPLTRVSGDVNGNELLDPGEAWVYTCETHLSITTSNIATAIGEANGLTVRDLAFATVVVAAVPGLPDAGSLPYRAADARASAPTISANKGLVTAPFGTRTRCVPETLLKQAPGEGPEDLTVYYCGNDGVRYPFPNPGTYLSWYEDFSAVRYMDANVLDSLPLGNNVTYRPGSRLLKVTDDPKVYAVGKGGLLRWVTSEAVAQALYGADWAARVSDISTMIFNSGYYVGSPIALEDAVADATLACTVPTAFTVFLTSGSRNAQVRPLQTLLHCLGHFPADVASTGNFGAVTQDAVKKFQIANGIEAVGYVGPATRAALNRYTGR